MSVLIAHPGSGSFVRNAVEALHEAQLLERFATTVFEDPNARWQKNLATLTSLVGVSGSPLQRRQAPRIPHQFIRAHPWRELLRTLVSRADRNGVWTDRVWHWMTLDFDRWSASLLGPGTTAVYGYEFNALALFERAATQGIPRILEVPCAEHEYVSSLQEREWHRLGQADCAYARHTRQVREQRTLRRRAEFALATCVIANSEHTVDSYRSAGLRTDHFRVLPLGAELPIGSELPRFSPAAQVNLIWAGTFGVRKGAHLFLEALASLPTDLALHVDVYGSVELPESALAPCASRLRFHGAVSQVQLFEAFASSDALILPSLSDGWGLVVSEAMAHGLPVLATRAVGASDLIRDHVSGRVIAPGDVQALSTLLHWCVTERAQLHSMREPARAAVFAWQWHDYRRALARIVQEHLQHG